MSRAAWVWAQELDSSAKLLLLALVDHADDGVCSMSLDSLHRVTGLNKRTILSAMERLKASGLAEKLHGHGGRGAYVIRHPDAKWHQGVDVNLVQYCTKLSFEPGAILHQVEDSNLVQYCTKSEENLVQYYTKSDEPGAKLHQVDDLATSQQIAAHSEQDRRNTAQVQDSYTHARARARSSNNSIKEKKEKRERVEGKGRDRGCGGKRGEREIALPAEPSAQDAQTNGTNSGTRLPVDWTPTDAHRRAARQIISGITDVEIDMIADKFRDHWVAKPGENGRKLDWMATWRNWLRNELRFRSRPATGGRRVSPHRIGRQDYGGTRIPQSNGFWAEIGGEK